MYPGYYLYACYLSDSSQDTEITNGVEETVKDFDDLSSAIRVG